MHSFTPRAAARGWRRCVPTALCLAVAALLAAAPERAAAGTYVLQVCADPATGVGHASGPGAVLDGWAYAENVSFWQVDFDCSGSIVHPKGLRTYALNPFGTPASPGAANQGVGSWIRFTAPADTEVAAIAWYRYASSASSAPDPAFARIVNADGLLLELTTNDETVGANAGGPFFAGNLLTIPNVDSPQVRIEIGCGSSADWSCGETAANNLNGVELTLYGGTITLRDDLLPTVSGAAVSGSGADRTVGFDAADLGGGLVEAELELDGTVVQTLGLDGGLASCAQPYRLTVPCPLSAPGKQFQFSGLAAGDHEARVIVADVAGNAGDSGFLPFNVPAPAAAPVLDPGGGGGGGASSGGGGSGERSLAALPPPPPPPVPDPGDGSTPPPPPSGQPRARARLGASSPAIANGHSVVFSGKLGRGGGSHANRLVELQVRVNGRWRTFAVARTRRSGRFRYRYRFTRTFRTTTYRFRALVRRQSGYPFRAGGSNRVNVTVLGGS